MASRLVGHAGEHKQQALGLGGSVAEAGAAVGAGLGRVRVLEIGHRIAALDPGLAALVLAVHRDCCGGALILSGGGVQ